MQEQPVILTIDKHGVARLTLNRRNQGNAFDRQIVDAICDIMGQLNNDSNVRAVILSGTDDVFCSGVNMNLLHEAVHAPPREFKDDARRLSHMLRSINECTKPIIARINGPAISSGVGLVAACDVAVACEEATFAFRDVHLGLSPTIVAPYIVAAIGARHARRFFLTGEQFSASKAKEIGLVHMVTLRAHLDETIDELIDQMLLGAPTAHAASKSIIQTVTSAPITEQIRELMAEKTAAFATCNNVKEGISAYLEKRRPPWAQSD